MAKYKPQHARLLFIDQQIRAKGYPSRHSLAEQWEVSYKTIGRDLDYMRYELDAPIEYSRTHRGFYYTEEEYRLPAMNIRESDLFAIYLADKLLGQYEGTPIYDSLKSVFSKIEDALPQKITPQATDEQARFTVIPPFSTTIVPEVLATVFACLRSSTRLSIEYQNPGGLPVSRQIDPYHGLRYEGDWYVIGYCHLRAEIRTFSLARIVAAKKGETRFTLPADFDYRQLSGSHFGVHWGKEDVVVRIGFTKRVAPYIQERQWHPSQQLEVQGDGTLVLSLSVNHLLELKRWILSWGADAKVLEPSSLAEEIRQTALQIGGLYG